MRANILILDKGVLVDCLNDISEEDLGGQGVAMMDNGLTVLTVPTINCGQQRRDKAGTEMFKTYKSKTMMGQSLKDNVFPNYHLFVYMTKLR